MKSMVYETGIDSEVDLVACIVSAAAEIRKTPGIFGRVRQSMASRCTVCLDVNGREFQHLFRWGKKKNWIHCNNSTQEWVLLFFRKKYDLFLLVCKVFGLVQRIMWHRMTYLHIPTSFLLHWNEASQPIGSLTKYASTKVIYLVPKFVDLI